MRHLHYLALAVALAIPGVVTARSLPEEPLPAARGPSSVPSELWHATASSIWAPGERCFDPAEEICTVRPEAIQPGGPAHLAPPNPRDPARVGPPAPVLQGFGPARAATPAQPTQRRHQDGGQSWDDELAQRVRAALLATDDRTKVEVRDGRVTLSGTARSVPERRMMVIRAMGVAGAGNVTNEIAVPG